MDFPPNLFANLLAFGSFVVAVLAYLHSRETRRYARERDSVQLSISLESDETRESKMYPTMDPTFVYAIVVRNTGHLPVEIEVVGAEMDNGERVPFFQASDPSQPTGDGPGEARRWLPAKGYGRYGVPAWEPTKPIRPFVVVGDGETHFGEPFAH